MEENIPFSTDPVKKSCEWFNFLSLVATLLSVLIQNVVMFPGLCMVYRVVCHCS